MACDQLAKEEVKMKNLLRLLLKTQHQQNRCRQDQTEKGMTLVELLVGAIMAFLIITPMLAFVVDMLNTDRREQVKANTEQDIQAAVDFIAQDLSQAIYIYDNGGINSIKSNLPANGDQKIPILVFWKRQRLKDAIPINKVKATTIKPKDCDTNEDNRKQCNDTDVLSLVAYYQFKDEDKTWCQPNGATCPTRIARYEIRDGLRNPDATDINNPYYPLEDTKESQQRDVAFDREFTLNKPTDKVTVIEKLVDSKGAKNPQVLLNYIDHNSVALAGNECRTALDSPKNPTNAQELPEDTLRVSDKNTNSFYACVDTQKNLARVTIRGNSLRRLQTDAKYDANKSAFFPTATVQVQGLGARGK